MDRKTMTTLAGGIIVLMILVVLVDSLMGGMPGTVRELYEQEITEIGSGEGRMQKARARIDELVGSDPPFLDPIAKREDWQGRLDESQGLIDEAKAKLEGEAMPLFEENNSDDTQKMTALLGEIRTARTTAVKGAEAIAQRAEKLVDYKARRHEMVREAEADFRSIDSSKLAPLKVKAGQAQVDWSEKKSDIDERMRFFDQMATAASESHDFIVAENGKPEASIDFDALVNHHQALRQAAGNYNQSLDSVSALLDQLYVSWDKLLADMEIREGAEVEFFHHYKLIRVNRDDKQSVEEKAERVSKEFYQRHEDHLGMTLESKPKGKYDVEADKVASPPGYNYVGNTHYGRWEQRPGGSFWVFYGQYAFMRSLFWGPSYYRNVGYNDWQGYRSTRDAGRTYYGKDASGKQVYGSKGTMARTKYAGSKYTRSGGYSSTQFKRSGGTYRGSKYATKSSRSFSSRSRSSRSFGGK